MGLFGHEYKVHHETEVGMVNTPNQVGDTLKGAIFESQMFKGSDLAYILREKSLNSITGTLWKLAKHCQPGGKYSEILGTPSGTLLLKPLTKNILSSSLGSEVSKVISTKISQADEYVYAAYLYDQLVSEYSFTGDIEANTGQIKVEGKYYTYEGFHYSNNEFTHEAESIYLEYSTTQIQHTVQGPQEVKVRSRIYFELDLQPNVDYLVVKYETDSVHYLVWNTTDTDKPELTKWFNSNQVSYYPSFFVRRNNASIREDEEYFDTACKALKRTNLDFEDLTDSYNGVTKLNKETQEDKDYRNSLGDVRDIALTFAVDVTANDQRVMRYLFEFFSYVYETQGLNKSQIDYKCSDLQYTFSWNEVTKEIRQGRVAPFHRFITETVNISTPYTIPNSSIIAYKSTQGLRIARQLDAESYAEIIVTGINWSTNNNGKTDSYSLPEFHNLHKYTAKDYTAIEKGEMEAQNSKVLIPLIPFIVREKFGAVRGNDLLALGLAYVMHVYKKTKKKWYATKWFSVVRIIASIAIIIGTWGYGTPAVFSINAFIQAGIQVLITVLIMLAVKIAMKILVKVFKIKCLLVDVFMAVYDFVCTVYSPLYAIGNTAVNIVSEVITTGRVSQGMLTDMLCSMAGTSLMATDVLGAIAGVAFKLGTNPSFYGAIQTKNYAGAIVMGASVIAEAVAIQIGMNNSENKTGQKEGSGNENNSGQDSNNSGKDNSNNQTDSSGKSSNNSPTEEPTFTEKLLDFRNTVSLTGSLAGSVSSYNAQRTQSQLADIQGKANTLSAQMQASVRYWDSVLSPNNIIAQQLIIEKAIYPDNPFPVFGQYRHINDYAGEFGIRI